MNKLKKKFQTNNLKLAYRYDIDCLRALAVLIVIFYHMEIPFFSGGFLGVDIFFVISGYLITSLILYEIRNKSFNIFYFYERRIRRILPALFFLLFIVTIFFDSIYLPDEILHFHQTILSTIFFYSNFFFLEAGSYFDPINKNLPLMHTWSLAIEEQFYIIFPFFLFIFRNQFKIVIFFLVVLFLSSLFLSQFGGNLKFNYPYYDQNLKFTSVPGFAFYFTGTRIWELLAGSITSIYLFQIRKKIPKSTLFSIVGYFLIFISLIIFDKNTPHPSFYTLIAVLGVILIIIYNSKPYNQNILLKLFNNTFFLKIGLASYSLYLWHQPIYQFYETIFLHEKNYMDKIILLLIIFLISFISYYFIEKKFRNKKFLDRKKIFLLFFGLTFVMATISIYKIYFKEYNNNYDPAVLKIVNNKNYYKDGDFICSSAPKNFIKPKNSCILGSQNNIRMALIGDSHAAVLSKKLGEKLNKIDIGAHQLTYEGCLPAINYKIYNQDRFRCDKYHRQALDLLKNNKEIESVLLYARWSLLLMGERFKNFEGGNEIGENHYLIDINDNTLSNLEDRKIKILKNLKFYIETISKLDKKIFIVLPTPEMGWDIPTNLARKLMLRNKLEKYDLSISKEVFKKRNYEIIDFFLNIKEKANIKLIYVDDIFCDEQRCLSHIDDKPLFFDDDHLGDLGNELLSQRIINHLENNL